MLTCFWLVAPVAVQLGTAADLPERAVLEGVPRAGYDVHLCPFPGSLYACLEYLGDTPDYDYIMGVRRLYNRDDGGNVDLMYLAPEPHQRAFAALGYQFSAAPREDKAAMIRAIKESIAAGRPVIAFVLVGPPEAGIVTGYDKGGETLIGWSYFQDQKEKYCEIPDWFGTMSHAGLGVIVIGEKAAKRPSDRETLISSLKWAIDLARTPKRPGLPDHASGLAAYDAWADGLEVDADYPADDAKTMDTRGMVQCDQCAMLYERHSAAAFLRQMAMVAPEAADHLGNAAMLYDQTADCGARLWRWQNWNDPATHQGFAMPDVRREMARDVRSARDKEAQAVAELEKALADLQAAPK
jgi:hypothetical protein